MDALSTSIEVKFSPNVADAEEGSASITSAILAINTIELSLCVPSGMVIPGSKPGVGCMRFLLRNWPRYRERADLRIIRHSPPDAVGRWARNGVKNWTAVGVGIALGGYCVVYRIE